MAIDTREKRASVPGVGRPWMRGKNPDGTKVAGWRAASGNAYSGNAFGAPAVSGASKPPSGLGLLGVGT